jgi:hypothetical protein
LRQRGGPSTAHATASWQEPVVPRPLAAEFEGFSLHAAVRIPQGCRSQLSRLPDGRVQYELKRRWRDGSTSVVLDPCTLIERLCRWSRARGRC